MTLMRPGRPLELKRVYKLLDSLRRDLRVHLLQPLIQRLAAGVPVYDPNG